MYFGNLDVKVNNESFVNNSHGLLLNAYYDFYTIDKVSFFLNGGAGLGLNQMKYKAAPGSIVDTILGPTKTTDTYNFIWNVGAGMSYAISEKWKTDLGYRYLDLGIAKSKGTKSELTSDATMHQVVWSLRYAF